MGAHKVIREEPPRDNRQVEVGRMLGATCLVRTSQRRAVALGWVRTLITQTYVTSVCRPLFTGVSTRPAMCTCPLFFPLPFEYLEGSTLVCVMTCVPSWSCTALAGQHDDSNGRGVGSLAPCEAYGAG